MKKSFILMTSKSSGGDIIIIELEINYPLNNPNENQKKKLTKELVKCNILW